MKRAADAYLDFFFTQRDLADYTRSDDLVGLWILLVLGLQNSMILGARAEDKSETQQTTNNTRGVDDSPGTPPLLPR